MKVLSKISKSPLVKLTSLNSVQILLKMCIGFITSKLIAVYVGTAGMGLLGNFRSFLSLLENIGLLGFQNGLVQKIAETEPNSDKFKKIITTSGVVLFGLSILISLFSVFGIHYLTASILKGNESIKVIFYVLAICFPFYIASTYFTSIINGLHHYKNFIWIQIISSLIGLLITSFFTIQFGTFGALLSLLFLPVVVLVISCFYIRSFSIIKSLFKISNFDWPILKSLLQFSLMAFVSGVIGSFVLLQIRNEIIRFSGLENAGIYEGLQRISSYYLLFISSIISIYFLPKLAAASTKHEEISILKTFYKNIIPVFFMGIVLLYFLKEWIIQLLFTSEFNEMSSLFFYQLFGDLLKAMSLILGYYLIAKQQTKVFIITELFSLLVMYISTHYLLLNIGIQGVVMAHLVTYAVYLLVLFFYFYRLFFRKN